MLLCASVILLISLLILMKSFTYSSRCPFYTVPVVGSSIQWPGKSFASHQYRIAESALKYRNTREGKGLFRVLTPAGWRILLPGRSMNELRNSSSVSFVPDMQTDNLSCYVGFQAFQKCHSDITRQCIKERFPGLFRQMIPLLALDSAKSMRNIFPASHERHESFLLKDSYVFCIQSTARFFLGKDLVENKRWQRLFIAYTQDAFASVAVLRSWPRFLRPLIYWIHPTTYRLRREEGELETVLKLLIAEVDTEPCNLLGCIQETAQRHGNLSSRVVFTFLNVILALHAMAIIFTNVLFDLACSPDCIPLLREEMHDTVQKHGWGQEAFNKMRLLDSVLKESFRLHPSFMITMNRRVIEPVCLSDGNTLPQNALVSTMLTDMMNPDIYPHPQKFDAFRFLKLSFHTGERKWHFASTSMEHVGFGHGYYSCPGRGFVSDVLKMMLAQFISHYDWDYVQEQPGDLESVHRESPDPNSRISFKIRSDTPN